MVVTKQSTRKQHSLLDDFHIQMSRFAQAHFAVCATQRLNEHEIGDSSDGTRDTVVARGKPRYHLETI